MTQRNSETPIQPTLVSSRSTASWTRSIPMRFSLPYRHSCETWRGCSVSTNIFSRQLLARVNASVSVTMFSISFLTSVCHWWMSLIRSLRRRSTSCWVLAVRSSASRQRRDVSNLNNWDTNEMLGRVKIIHEMAVETSYHRSWIFISLPA